MKNPLLSIIIPVYNTEKYLAKCLDSVLEQSYKNIEIIVVDDASPGDAKGIVDKYKTSNKVNYVRQIVNSGLFHARLAGVAKATGDYITFVDSDDYVSFDFYRLLMKEAVEGDFDIVSGSTVIEKESGRKLQYVLHDEALAEVKLRGVDVRNTFYAQEGNCYAWHTIWNKVYKKTLWDKCLPEYSRIKTHLIMTEDIAFSSVLFYKAESFSATKSDAYYYCQHTGASTDAGTASFKKVVKNIKDITTVFDFLGNFLEREKADKVIFEHYENFRKRYYVMWNNLFESYSGSDAEMEHMQKLVLDLKGSVSVKKDDKKKLNKQQFYFDSISADWYDDLEKIKFGINDEEIEIVSFDIFDTLLMRPLWNPEDVFKLMQKKFETEFPKADGVSFLKVRRMAETSARTRMAYLRPGNEDVTLHEIYVELGNVLGADKEKIARMEAHEREVELLLSQPRRTGASLFEFAKSCNKKVILVSDMYLECDIIEKMLAKHGIAGYDSLFVSSEKRQLKATGNLFKAVLSELDVKPSKVLHIGDNYEHDVVKARECGMKSMFLPKTRDRFANGLKDMPTNFCASIGCLTGYSLTTWDTLFNSIGYRSMMAMVANKFFDNPFRSWNTGSDLGSSPTLIGYYTVGMHLMGLSKWIIEQAKVYGTKKICFLARDGYLPQKAFKKLQPIYEAADIKTEYVPCSRRSLLPWTIDNEMGMLDLPVEFRAHSPMSLSGMLSCCMENYSEEELQQLMEKAGWNYRKKFTSELDYYRWQEWFKSNLFSAEALKKSKEMARKYYSNMIPKDALVFDLGYSGSILVSLQKCLGYSVKFLYVHHENDGFLDRKEKYGLDVKTMYDFVPFYSDLIREYFLSESNNSCIRLEQADDGNIVPVLENITEGYIDQFALHTIQHSALEFIDDFKETFGEYAHSMTFDPVLVSMPFEGMIQNSSHDDRMVLMAASSEDLLYGDQSNISMFDFWKNQPAKEISRGKNSMPQRNIGEFFLFPYNRVKEGSKIVIYGAGKVGRDYLWQMEKTNYCKVVAVVDTNFHGKPGCESPERLRTVDYDYILCAVGMDHLFNGIKNRIKNINPALEGKIIYAGRVNRMEL